MKKYASFGALAREMKLNFDKLPATYAVAMEEAAVLVEATAKAEIGTYQISDMGPFNPWPQLAPSTIAEKRSLGYADEENDNPLLRTGEMRDSIAHESAPTGFCVGSPSEILVYQELGTSRGLPPRPVLAPALYRSTKAILKLIGRAVEKRTAGKP